MAGAASFDATCRTVYADAAACGRPASSRRCRTRRVAEIAPAFGARGAALTYACACASSAVAIGEAMRAIRGGWIDIAIVGGTKRC